MKTKLIFLALTALVFQSANVFAVENAVGGVDKDYQHELICQASTETEDFELNLKWSILYIHLPDGRAPQVKKEFKYELKNLTANTAIGAHFGNFFGDYADISDVGPGLHVAGKFFMYKRLGYREEKTDIVLDKDSAGQYSLNSLQNKAIETFQNPKDYCNPPTRLCGSEPPLPEPKIVLNLIFKNSTCQLIN